MDLEVLKTQKKRLKLTNAEVARLSGVSLGTINKVFSGATKAPQIDTMQAILKVLRMDSGFPTRSEMETQPYSYQLLLQSEREAEEAKEVMHPAEGVEVAERIRGRLYFAEAPGWRHQQCLLEAAAQIQSYLRGIQKYTKEEKKKNGVTEQCLYQAVLGPVQVRLDEDGDTVLYPDLVLCKEVGQIQHDIVWGAPDFVMEVAAGDDSGYTFVQKMRTYLQAGVKEYWMIEGQRGKILTVWNGGDTPQFREYTFLEKVPSRLLKGMMVSMARIELYM